MKVKTAGAKAVILDTILFTDDVDEKGKNVKRVSFNKKHLRSILRYF